MKIFLISFTFALVLSMHLCFSDKHTYGKHEYKLYERVLIKDVNKRPKIYDIHFKYFTTFLKPIAYIEFDIDSPSNGSIETTWGIQKHPLLDTEFSIQNFDAKIHINETLNVQATLTMYGRGSPESSGIMCADVLEAMKSLIFIYVKNVNSTQKTFAQNSIGKRQTGDQLIHYQSKNVTNISHFPSSSFEYLGEEYITYVGFSFNSPTAMALVNTSFISEKEFNAVVYDMNAEHFVANISVYGIRSTDRPENFKGLL